MFNTDLNNGGGDRVGTIKAWGGTTAPAGWLICDGSAISRTLYAGLFAVIGTTYGAGDGTTTFNLPDMLGFCKNQSIIGNGKTIGLYNGSTYYGTSTQNTYYTTGCLGGVSDNYGNNIGVNTGALDTTSGVSIGITPEAAKSGIITTNSATQETRAIIKY